MRTCILVLIATIGSALAICNTDDHHPENDGYFFKGVSGLTDEVNPDSNHGHRLPNATWVPGAYYPYGEKKICDAAMDPFCRPPCSEEPGCSQFVTSHTCSILQFCPPEGDTEGKKVYKMPDFEATEGCDFTNAQELGRTLEVGSETGCFEYAFEDDHELTDYYFSSQEGCNEGQKIAVQIVDFTETADQCSQMGLTTSRIRNCDCRLEKKGSTLSEPCRSAFSDSCMAVMNEGEGDCCDTGTCISTLEDFSHPDGTKLELERRSQCDDDMPGMCYNEDGMGTATNREGSTDCCSHQCSTCGIELSPSVMWKPCTAFDGEAKTGKCGYLSRYDQEMFECDFSLCDDDNKWSINGEAFAKAAGIPFKSDESSDANKNDSMYPAFYLAFLMFTLL